MSFPDFTFLRDSGLEHCGTKAAYYFDEKDVPASLLYSRRFAERMADLLLPKQKFEDFVEQLERLSPSLPQHISKNLDALRRLGNEGVHGHASYAEAQEALQIAYKLGVWFNSRATISLIVILRRAGYGALIFLCVVILAVVVNQREISHPTLPAQPSQRPEAGSPPAVVLNQRAVLYEEEKSSTGLRHEGSAQWRTLAEKNPSQANPASELTLVGDFEIPSVHLSVNFLVRRKGDSRRASSHTIQITFTPAQFREGGVVNVPGVLVKPDELSAGTPLAGLSAKIKNGYFIFGLSPILLDVQKNTQLLNNGSWFDIPMVYASGRRAILAVEKGASGDRAFREAFAAWTP